MRNIKQSAYRRRRGNLENSNTNHFARKKGTGMAATDRHPPLRPPRPPARRTGAAGRNTLTRVCQENKPDAIPYTLDT